MLCYAFYNCLHFYIESVIAYLLVYLSVSWCILVYLGVSWCILAYLGVSWFLLAILYNYYKYKDITLAVPETLEYSYFFNFNFQFL